MFWGVGGKGHTCARKMRASSNAEYTGKNISCILILSPQPTSEPRMQPARVDLACIGENHKYEKKKLQAIVQKFFLRTTTNVLVKATKLQPSTYYRQTSLISSPIELEQKLHQNLIKLTVKDQQEWETICTRTAMLNLQLPNLHQEMTHICKHIRHVRINKLRLDIKE